MLTKKMEFSNAVLDIVFVFLLQIAIIFLIIVVPCILVILRAAGAAESSEIVLKNMSSETMRSLIDESMFITSLRLISAPISIAVAPLIYESVKDSRKKENHALLRAYLQGFHTELRSLLFSCMAGFVCAGLLIGITVLSKEQKEVHFVVENITFGLTALHLLSICLLCAAQELFIRHYFFLKTARFSVAGYILLNNLIFAFSLCRTMDVPTVQGLVSLLLVSFLMTLHYLRKQNIAENIGFRSVYEMLLFLFCGDANFGSFFSILLLLVLLAAEFAGILLRKEKIGRWHEELH